MGGHREMIDDGKTGFLFKADDRTTLIECVQDVLASREHWDQIRANGQAMADNRSWQAVTAANPPLSERLCRGLTIGAERSKVGTSDTKGQRRRGGTWSLYPLAVLPIEMPLLRLQQSCRRDGGSRTLEQSTPCRARPCRRWGWQTATKLDFFRRRNTIFDGAQNRCRPDRAGH